MEYEKMTILIVRMSISFLVTEFFFIGYTFIHLYIFDEER